MAYKDTLGDILKAQEQEEAGKKADPYLPLVARIDGKCFSKFTKGLNRPFDERFVRLMVATTKHLVEQSEALLGYCQSDEISLYWYLDKENFSNREYWFGGKFQKLTSVLAGTASSFFSGNLPLFLPEKVGQYPVFDCRVWNVPDLEHVYKNFLWRLNDATKNSVSMYAHHNFSHKLLQGKTCTDMKEMLAANGTLWENLPRFFTHGTYVRRQRVFVSPDDPSFDNVPEAYRPTKPVIRTVVSEWTPETRLSVADFSPGAEAEECATITG
jgi:tRNA(His) 5'-end guanylyltransferase